MNLLNSMRAFVEVAKQGGLARAAKKLNMSAPSITRLVGDFETWAGAPLLIRTTRHVSLTELGEELLPKCTDILESIDAVKSHTESEVASPSGTLRITAARVIVRTVIAPLVPKLLSLYPRLKVHLDTTNQPVNVISEHFDLAIRVGELEDSTLVAKKLGESKLVLTASPDFIASHGEPRTIEDLKDFTCLIDTIPRFASLWPVGNNKSRLDGPVTVSDGEIVRDLTMASLGISFLPKFVVQECLDNGSLVQIMKKEESPKLSIYAVFPPRPYISDAARAFSELIAEKF